MLVFVDSNVLLYARDSSEPAKQPLAHDRLSHLWRARAGRASFQVLHEYYVTVTRKLQPGLDPETAREDLRPYLHWAPVRLDGATLEAAWAIEKRHSISFWDALIAAAAQIAGCEILLTEDLQDGLQIDGVRAVDPFRHTPASILL